MEIRFFSLFFLLEEKCGIHAVLSAWPYQYFSATFHGGFFLFLMLVFIDSLSHICFVFFSSFG
jgi:hypothetical protein